MDSFALLTATGAEPDGTHLVLTSLVGVAAACPDGSYDFTGFFAPVNDQPRVNTVQAGQAIPVKFALGGDQGMDVLADGSPASRRVDCESGAGTDEVEQTVTAGASTLSYDPGTGRYLYVWKTNSDWAGTCRLFTLKLDDGTTHTALFSFR